MANKECLRSLEQTLNSNEPDVVLITLQTLHICALTPINRPTLCEVPNLRSTLFFLSEEHPKPEIRRESGQLLNQIEPEEEYSDDDDDDETVSSSHDTDITAASRFVPKQLHVCSLRIGNIRTAQQREKFQKEAVKHHAVVSATMGSQLQRATFYTTQPDIKDELIQFLTNSGYECLDDKQEMAYFGKRNHYDETYNAAPSYLAPRKANQTKGGDPSKRYSLGQWRPNSETDSLAARLAKYKAEKENAKKENTSVKSVFSQ